MFLFFTTGYKPRSIRRYRISINYDFTNCLAANWTRNGQLVLSVFVVVKNTNTSTKIEYATFSWSGKSNKLQNAFMRFKKKKPDENVFVEKLPFLKNEPIRSKLTDRVGVKTIFFTIIWLVSDSIRMRLRNVRKHNNRPNIHSYTV